MNTEKHASVDEVTKWFRELLMRLLGWGTATFVVVAGWFVTQDQNISRWSEEACALIVFSTLLGTGWAVTVFWVHKKCDPTHPTVVSKTALSIYVAFVLVCLALLVVFVAIDPLERKDKTAKSRVESYNMGRAHAAHVAPHARRYTAQPRDPVWRAAS